MPHTNELPEPEEVVPPMHTQACDMALHRDPGIEQTQEDEVPFHCEPGGQKVMLPVDVRLPEDVTPLVGVNVYTKLSPTCLPLTLAAGEAAMGTDKITIPDPPIPPFPPPPPPVFAKAFGADDPPPPPPNPPAAKPTPVT